MPPGSIEPGSESPPPGPEDERDLIRRCIAGDVSAFEPLVERYRQRVWRLAYQVLGDREEAWDCTQEAFVRAFHSLPSFRGQSAFYTWLFRITVNVATDRQRARSAQTRAFGAERVAEEEWRRVTPDPGAGPDKAAVQSEQRERIRRALDALPPKARAIIMLSDVEGLSYREIADVLRCPIGTVMSRLHNARKRLKTLLGPGLAVLIWLAVFALSATAAEAQPMIRFGVRVLYASNTNAPEAATSPNSGAPLSPAKRSAPPPSAAAPGSPSPSGSDAPAPAPTPTPLASDPYDPAMRRILPKLRELFRYTEYVSIERHRVDGPLGTVQRFSIPGDRWLEVTPDQLEGQSVRMHVRLLRGERPEMSSVLLAAPRAPAIFGGLPYGNGVLIVILWANPELAGAGAPFVPPRPRRP
jgi:RNA polymerase sigma-70 factor (ECF subfamily)